MKIEELCIALKDSWQPNQGDITIPEKGRCELANELCDIIDFTRSIFNIINEYPYLEKTIKEIK